MGDNSNRFCPLLPCLSFTNPYLAYFKEGELMPKPKPFLTKMIAGTLQSGLDALDAEIEPHIPEDLKALINELPISEELKTFLLPLSEKTSRSPVGTLAMMAIGMVAGTALGIAAPLARVASYGVDRLAQSYRLDPSTVTRLWLRAFPSEEDKEDWWSELRDQGASSRKIEAFKELANYLPTPGEIMTWAAREVFEPELREKYQLDKFLPPEFLTWAAKVGITGEVAKNFWASHWVLPSLTAIQELWRRQILNKEDVDAFWTELDMVPWVREDLFKLFRAVPTRVDVRRFWDMRTINEPRLRDIYKAQGYWEEDLEDYITWTKVYVDFPDLMARYSKGWISLEDVKTKLLEDGMSEERYEELLQTKIKKETPERLIKERDLTKADIYRGVKKEVISRREGQELLQGMGYDAFEAIYILDLNAPLEETVTEVKRRELTKTDIVKGLKAKVITEKEALSRLIELRYIPSDAEFLLSILKRVVKPPTVTKEREASKADIIEGVKKGLITSKEGHSMLLDIGFSPDAADFILEVRIEEPAFSPHLPMEFRQLVESYRRSQGLDFKEVPLELLEADRKRSELQSVLSQAISRKAPEDEIAQSEADLEIAEIELKGLKASYGL